MRGMPPTRPPSAGRAAVLPRPVPTSTRVSPSAASASPAHRIMVAGIDKDARGAVEASVRQALLGSPVDSGPWSVSIVSLAGKWSVTLDGGRLRGASFVVEPDRLTEAIREAVEGGPPTAGPAPAAPEAPAASPTEARDPHVCEYCGKAVVVVYERRRPDESQEIAPLACPHCWRIGHVSIGVWAATGRDYRAEKA
jgi:hypothetical protein